MRKQSLIKVQIMDALRLRRGASSQFAPRCLFRGSAATGFLNTEQCTGSEHRRAINRTGPHTYLETAAHWLLALWFVMALSACGSGNSDGGIIPPFTITSSVAVGDLNSDGLPDVASANTYIAGPPPHPGHISVILHSQSSPGAFNHATILKTGSDTWRVSIGDLNADNLPDLVAANQLDLSIFFQDSSSPGTFLPAKTLRTLGVPNEIAIGDLNGDGYLDLAVADSRLSIHFQDATAPSIFSPPVNLGVSCSDIDIADLNGDGRADLIAAVNPSTLEDASRPGHAIIFLQNPAQVGSFLPPQTVPTGFQPTAIAIADLNADGRLDLAIANLGTPDNTATASLSVLLNNSISPGSFLPATNYVTGDRSQSVSIGDLNGDGRPDIAVANAGVIGNTGSISVLFQNPGAPGTFLTTVDRPGTSQPLGVTIADLNGDTLADIALADDGVRILFQIPSQPGTFRTPMLVRN